MRRLSAALVALALVAVACGDDDGDRADTTTTSTTTPTTTAPSTTTSPPTSTTNPTDTAAPAPGCDPLPGAGTDPVEVASAGDVAVLSDVVLREDECFDLFVLRFRPPADLGYHVRYVDGEVTECGSGERVEPGGAIALVVSVVPATSFDFDAGQPAYDGPRELPGGGAVQGAVVACDFEADLTWVLGLDERRPFLVTADEASLTVEIA